MRLRLRTRSGARRRGPRAAAAGAALLLAGGLAVTVTQVAGADPQPSVSSVKGKINTLTGEFNKANQQYDQVEQQLAAASTRLKQVTRQLNRDQARYEAARKLGVQISDSSYEDSNSSSLAGLLTAADPSQVLSQASLILQITGTRNLETTAFLAAATQVADAQQEQQRTKAGITQLADQKKSAKNHIATLLSAQKK